MAKSINLKLREILQELLDGMENGSALIEGAQLTIDAIPDRRELTIKYSVIERTDQKGNQPQQVR